MLFLVAISFIPRFLGAYRADLTWDEGLYVMTGLASLRNLGKKGRQQTHHSLEFHPPLVMYIFGISYAAYVLWKSLLSRGPNLSRASLEEQGIRMFRGQSALLACRLPSVVFGTLTVVATYLFATEISGNDLIGITAAVAIALNPAFLGWSSLATLESGLTFFTTAVFLSLVTIDISLGFFSLVLPGLLLGLVFSSKETGYSLPFAILPWAVGWALMSGTAPTIILFVVLTSTWLLIGFAVHVTLWPLLWKHPIMELRKNLSSVRGMATRKDAGVGFYPFAFLAVSPMPLVILSLIGIAALILAGSKSPDTFLILGWFLVPLSLFSLPMVPKRGGASELAFIYPAFSILVAFGANFLSTLFAGLTPLPGLGAPSWMLLFAILLAGFLSLITLKHLPYLTNYSGAMAKVLRKRGHGLSYCWGEGFARAISYIDQHAPKNSVVWIYGPKGPALYHSGRVSLSQTLKGKALLQEREKAGYDVRLDFDFERWREGDLRFHFPYYNADTETSLEELRDRNVSYVVIYRWATYHPNVTGMSRSNWDMIARLQSNYRPEVVIENKGDKVAWIYNVARPIPAPPA